MQQARQRNEERQHRPASPLVIFGGITVLVVLLTVGTLWLWNATRDADEPTIASRDDIGAIVSDPERFDGQEVTLRGEIEQMIGVGAFELEQNALTEGDSIHVFAVDGYPGLDADAVVRITGEVTVVGDEPPANLADGVREDFDWEGLEGAPVVEVRSLEILDDTQ